MSDLFTEENQTTVELPFTNPDEVKLEDLVGEDKKYKTNSDLVKALAHGQNHIARIETENKQHTAELAKRASVDEAIKRLTEQAEQKPNSGPDDTPTPDDKTPSDSDAASITLEDVKKLLAEDKQVSTKEKNLQTVNSRLVEVAGSEQEAQALLVKRSEELGVSLTRMKELAAETPAVFFKLIDLDSKDKSNSPANSKQKYSRTPSQRAPNAEILETSADFAELRKTDRSRYFSPEVQQKLIKVREREIIERNQT